jgi:hypothetical protein
LIAATSAASRFLFATDIIFFTRELGTSRTSLVQALL